LERAGRLAKGYGEAAQTAQALPFWSAIMRFLAAILCLAISASAHAANLPALRSEVASASARAQGLSDQRAKLERTLGEIASRIETLKAQRAAQGALFRDPELDELLKQSQDLSTRLSAYGTTAGLRFE
jgi:septal ring factor EnvC (AmiA/AmiB activator)